MSHRLAWFHAVLALVALTFRFVLLRRVPAR